MTDMTTPHPKTSAAPGSVDTTSLYKVGSGGDFEYSEHAVFESLPDAVMYAHHYNTVILPNSGGIWSVDDLAVVGEWRAYYPRGTWRPRSDVVNDGDQALPETGSIGPAV